MSEQGQSTYTKFKEYRFGPVFAQSIRISKAKSIAKYAFYHVDLNSGSGFNEEVQVEGSPLNFLGAVQRHDRPDFHAFFCDKDPNAIRPLVHRLENRPDKNRIYIFQGDNSEILPVVSQFIAPRETNPQFAVGSIVIDPNGYHSGVPWESLRTFCRTHPRFDMFFNLNVRTYRMERAHILSGKWKDRELYSISRFTTLFSRPHWMWSEITSFGGHHWIQCVGRSFKTAQSGYESLGYYDSRSERGQRILEEFDGVKRTSSQLQFLQELPGISDASSL